MTEMYYVNNTGYHHMVEKCIYIFFFDVCHKLNIQTKITNIKYKHKYKTVTLIKMCVVLFAMETMLVRPKLELPSHTYRIDVYSIQLTRNYTYTHSLIQFGVV